MLRFVASLAGGVLVGIALGFGLGWGVFPVEYDNSPAADLAFTYKEEYTVMVADGFQADRDTLSAVERLRLLEVASIPQHVQDVTERYISNSRDIDEICALVDLSGALDRLTPIMSPYRDVCLPGGEGV